MSPATLGMMSQGFLDFFDFSINRHLILNRRKPPPQVLTFWLALLREADRE
jgi:hypothetical protein